MTHTNPVTGPLAGITVLDLSRALAGPYATSLLGDMGATVVKIESITGGDSSRAWPPFDGSHSLYFDSVNRNKSSVVIDFYTSEGKALLRSLAEKSDVLIENFRPGVLAKIGLDPTELRVNNPGLIIASVSGFGSTGPLAQTAGLDQVAQGMSGLMSVTGSDRDHMYRFGVPIVDTTSGMMIAFGIAAALTRRANTGVGSDVSTSLLETALSLSVFQGQGYLSAGEVPEPQGNDHPLLSPYGVFRTQDIDIIIAVGSDKQFRVLAETLGKPSLAEDPKCNNSRARSENRHELAELINSVLAGRPGHEWLEEFRSAMIPCGPIHNYEQAFSDPQVKAIDMVRHVARADGSALPLLRGPLSIDGIPVEVTKAPPALGEDTRRVLHDFGVTADQIESLLGAGVIAEHLSDGHGSDVS